MNKRKIKKYDTDFQKKKERDIRRADRKERVEITFVPKYEKK